MDAFFWLLTGRWAFIHLNWDWEEGGRWKLESSNLRMRMDLREFHPQYRLKSYRPHPIIANYL